MKFKRTLEKNIKVMKYRLKNFLEMIYYIHISILAIKITIWYVDIDIDIYSLSAAGERWVSPFEF